MVWPFWWSILALLSHSYRSEDRDLKMTRVVE